MSNHGDTTPSGSQQPNPRSRRDVFGKINNTGRTDNTTAKNIPHEQAIVITEGDNVSLRRSIAQSPPIMVSNDELSKKSVQRG